MTKKIRTILSLTIITLFTSSCITTDNSMGSNLIPSDQDLKVNIKSFELPLQMQIPDSLQATNADYITVGALNHPILGKTRINSAVALIPIRDSIRFGEDPVAISFHIDIVATGDGYGNLLNVVLDENSKYMPQNISVRRLKVDLDSTMLYNNSISPEDISEENINTNSPVYFGGDSLKINLSLDFANEILSATDKELDSLILFAERFKGLYLETNETHGSIIGGGRINNFNLVDTRVYLKYSIVNKDKDSSSESDRKDTTISFALGYQSSLYNGEFGSKDLATDEPREIIYSEGMSGIKPYIKATDIKAIINKISIEENIDPKRIIISRASLVFPFSDFTQDYEFLNKYPSQIFPCMRIEVDNETGTIQYLPFPEIQRVEGATGLINRSLSHYKCDLTSHVTHLKETEEKDYKEEDNIWLFPIIERVIDSFYGTTALLPYNSLYYYLKLNGNESVNPPTIHITYVTI